MGALVLKVVKGMLLKLASEAFLKWLILWFSEIAVESTKTKKDDKFLERIKQELED